MRAAHGQFGADRTHLLGQEDARRADAADELVRGEEHGILVHEVCVLTDDDWIHVNREVCAGSGKVEDG